MGSTPTLFNLTEQSACLNEALKVITCFEEGQRQFFF